MLRFRKMIYTHLDHGLLSSQFRWSRRRGAKDAQFACHPPGNTLNFKQLIACTEWPKADQSSLCELCQTGGREWGWVRSVPGCEWQVWSDSVRRCAALLSLEHP